MAYSRRYLYVSEQDVQWKLTKHTPSYEVNWGNPIISQMPLKLRARHQKEQWREVKLRKKYIFNYHIPTLSCVLFSASGMSPSLSNEGFPMRFRFIQSKIQQAKRSLFDKPRDISSFLAFDVASQSDVLSPRDLKSDFWFFFSLWQIFVAYKDFWIRLQSWDLTCLYKKQTETSAGFSPAFLPP